MTYSLTFNYFSNIKDFDFNQNNILIKYFFIEPFVWTSKSRSLELGPFFLKEIVSISKNKEGETRNLFIISFLIRIMLEVFIFKVLKINLLCYII